MQRIEREIVSWVRKGEKLFRRDSVTFGARIRNAIWNIASPPEPQVIDAKQITLPVVEPPPPKSGKVDKGRRETKHRPTFSGPVVAVQEYGFAMLVTELGGTRVAIYGDTARIRAHLPSVKSVKCVATVPASGTKGARRYEYQNDGDLVLEGDEQEPGQPKDAEESPQEKQPGSVRGQRRSR